MSNQAIFERYFRFRCQQAGAVTPGQQLQVLRQLRREAEQEGRVPLSESSVVQVDLNNPAVQAVLRGEPVSVGARTVQPGRNGAVKLPRTSNGLANWQKVLILLGIFMLPVFLFLMLARNRNHPAAQPTPTLQPTVVLEATATPTMLPDGTPDVQPTAPAWQSVPLTGNGDHQVVYLPMDNPAAPEAVAPASVELGGRHFIIQIGEVDADSGVWNPKGGVEWLPTTFVRKVVAIPREFLEDVTIQKGDVIRMRMRDGFTANYQVTQVIPDLLTDRIEVFNGNTPSIVLIAYTNNLRDPRRLVIIGEMMLPITYQPVPYVTPTPTPTPTPLPTATPIPTTKTAVIGVDRANLRNGPSLYFRVIATLTRDTEVTIHTDVPTVQSNGYTWLFVSTPAGDGWMAENLVIPQE